MTKIAFVTLGCKVNQCESAGIIESLVEKGYSIVPYESEADIYIVNTCTVTGKTDSHSRYHVRRAHRLNPSASIIVTGCYAQIHPEEVAKLPGVKVVLGNAEKQKIPEIVTGLTDVKQKIDVGDISLQKEFSGPSISKFYGRTRAFLKVQDGCDSFCSYCIIPYARGRSRSLSEDKVIEQISILGRSGYKEIVLTGIHLGKYGQDFSTPSSLLNLLRKIEASSEIDRIRLSSIEPMEITDKLIDHVKNSSVICRHFHVPLQNGDDDILHLMKRNYNTKAYKYLIEKILDAIPDMAIGTDVMVGFPGEEEKHFENTLNFIQQTQFAYLHVFPYSERCGTEASLFPNPVCGIDKKMRGKILRELGKKKRMDFAGKFLGKSLHVLVEDMRDRETGYMKGLTDNYIPMFIRNGNSNIANSIVEVMAENAVEGKIVGRK